MSPHRNVRLRASLCHAAALGALLALLVVPRANAQPASFAERPDSVRLVTSDIARFWRVFDQAPQDSLASALQRDYLDHGTVGLRAFIPYRIRSAAVLARAVQTRRARYQEVRAATANLDSLHRAFLAPLYALEYLYPDAVFSDIYFVIGGLNSGGTATDQGVIAGVEMFREPRALVPLVAMR